MITIHNLNDFKLGNAAWQVANLIGYATLHGFSFGLLNEPWKFQHYFKHPLPVTLGRTPKILQETQFNYYELPAQDSVSLAGYWQSPKRFAHCMDLVKYYLTPSDAITEYLQSKYGHLLKQSPNRIGLHVRGQDYKVLSEYHTNLAAEYYETALHKLWINLVGYVQNPDPVVFAFTDDIDWCRKILPELKCIEITGNNEGQDFHLMTQMWSLVIANSSYSALAALIGQVKNVIAPKEWFQSKGPSSWQDIYHPDWVVI